jgi:hypothetical protein
MKNRIATICLIGMLAMIPGAVFAQHGNHSLEQVLVESADTAAEHNALAAHYRAKAADARAEAQRHEKMGHSYLQGKATEHMQMQRHCKNIAQNLNKQAEDYDALAKLQEAEAKKAK